MTEQQQQQRRSTTHPPPMLALILQILETHSVLIGLLLRLSLAWLLPWLFDVNGIVPGVAYTDIDYHIFVDAAKHVVARQSPYDRHTYRYTPFLAAALARLPQFEVVSRYLFCVADAICGWIILTYRQQKRAEMLANKEEEEETKQSTTTTIPIISPELQDALWWLYNPLAINICTRGSSESFQVLLPVLVTVTIVTTSSDANWNLRAFLAGLWHGLAIHSKLYPIIYSLSFMTFFATTTGKAAAPNTSTTSSSSSSSLLEQLISFVLFWAKRLLTPAPVIFLVTFLITTVALTYLAYLWYGPISLQEGLLYHFSRVDHRHNYSMHWYWIYLGRARDDFVRYQAIIGKLLLLPQLILLVQTSLQLAPHNLGLALFIQTYLFVTQNKVITAQYLTWYLCLLPLCSDCFCLTTRLQYSLVALAISYGLWLGSAYCLEMQGWAVHRFVWVASCIYYWANINVIGALLNSYQQQQQQQATAAAGSSNNNKNKTKLS